MSAQAAATIPFTLMPHQELIRDFLVRTPFAGAWLGVGAGKTLTTLTALQLVRPLGHVLVVAPVAIARSTWIDEITDRGFPIRTKSLIVDENDRELSKDARLQVFKEVLTDPPTMYFINQELLTQTSKPVSMLVSAPGTEQLPAEAKDLHALLCAEAPITQQNLLELYRDNMAAAHGGRPPAKTKVTALIRSLLVTGHAARESFGCQWCAAEGCDKCTYGLIDQMPRQAVKHNGRHYAVPQWPFPTVIIDESQSFKNHASARFKALAQVRPAVSRLIELTGTPSPNGLHDLWSQVYLLDQGQSLGSNITSYRNRWFTPKMVPGTTTPAKWVENPGAEAEIHASIKHLVMSVQNTNLNLPGLSIEDVKVSLPPDLLQTYKAFKRDLVLDIVTTSLTDEQKEKGPTQAVVKQIIANNQAVLTSKLLQFANGALYTSDPDEAEDIKGEYTLIHDKKLEMAEYLVRNNGNSPVLIAYAFVSDKELLMDRLSKAGVAVEAFDKSRAMLKRWNDGRIPALLIHPASAGHGLNFQRGGSTLLWYGLTYNLEHYLQTNGRLYRKGQLHPVTIYRLMTRGTHDERLPAVLAAKESVQTRLVESVDGDVAAIAQMEQEVLDDLSDLWLQTRL